MRNYYIIGANRISGEESWENVFSEMLKAQALDVGYARKLDLTDLYGKPENEIVSVLKAKREIPKSYHAHKLFLNLRPGDVVAVKKFAAPIKKKPRLVICGYATVRAIDGRVYHHHRSGLPHRINAVIQPCDSKNEFRIGGYGGTIHRLSNPDHILKIFQPFLGKFSAPDQAELHDRKTISLKENALRNIDDYEYQINKRIKATAEHNRLQKLLYNQLVKTHGTKCVLMERDWVDIQVRLDKQITLYEVKPYPTAFLCLREGLGQILLYAWKQGSQSGVTSKLVIAGPCKMTTDEENFLKYLRSQFRQELEYLALC